MKRLFILVLALVMCFFMFACSKENDETVSSEENSSMAVSKDETSSQETLSSAAQNSSDEESIESSQEPALYLPYIGKWVCSDDYYVIVNEDGSIIYNGEEFTPEYFVYGDGIGAAVYDATYTYRGGIETFTGKGCVFVWGLTERFGEGVMVGDHDGRHFILQTE